MRTIFILAVSLLIMQSVSAQETTPQRSELLKFPCAATVEAGNIQDDWDPQLQSLEMPAPGSGSYRRFLIDLKDELYSNYIPQGTGSAKTSEESELSAPLVNAGWEGNPMGSSVPNDNDLAISNNGIIISVINTTIYMYDSTGALLYNISLHAFSDTLGIPDSKFDPKVLYDPQADKFVLVYLSGFTPTTTNIIVAFSQTNDPTGNWNFYSLPGNPKDNDRWTDFPMIALTETELFLTINLIIPDEPWQTGFSETLIWQMSLEKGYSADTLDAVYYDDIFFGGNPIRNLNPVRGGSTIYGPDLYFLSNRNFSPANDTIFIVRVTGTLDDPSTIVEVDYSIADLQYGVPPQARQYLTHIFDTNDGRILGSFYEDGQIQFVSNSLDPTTGFCGIYHGVITELDGEKVIQANIIGDDTLDLGYPNISYTGTYDGDNQSIITFDHTAPTVYAGMSGVFYNWGAYSDLVNIKTGDTYVNVLSGAYERWGDYTGSQRKYNDPGTVWVSGNFGKLIEAFPFTSRNNATWITSLKSTVQPTVGTEHIQNESAIAVYPNPASDYFQTHLDLPVAGTLQFRIYDMQGNMLEFLLQARGNEGENLFSFSTEQLPAGNYILEIRLNGEVLESKQVVKM